VQSVGLVSHRLQRNGIRDEFIIDDCFFLLGQYAEKITAARSGMARAAEKAGRDSTHPLTKVTLGTTTNNN
jgi:hypothetical protein